ncbi:dihydropteroate synthase [Thetidibacter halocola]|uniref:Dihydropteroate synthase n=1 Tax=Thetidibacter halocola TaxID=2827239 RepID=A0A8J8B7L6_9RHOB|nr:dihydropteroate synthase [Thetidibacter halocola]MBS0124547.1 dihydropteroate synthase [Thetidibacter halocola]
MSAYYRPLVQQARPRPTDAAPLAGGTLWFTHAVRHSRDAAPQVVPLSEIPQDWMTRLTAARAPLLGIPMDAPCLMGILNVTPDSFSDGGRHKNTTAALLHAREMVQAGAAIIDVGGESTRPGSQTVPAEAEIARVEPVITALRHEAGVPISIDTRKCSVAQAAVDAGARLVNDVSGFTHDPALARYCARHGLPVCVMHAQGDPETMHLNPSYADVLLDIYDFLERQVAHLEGLGIPRARILVDPGIGFGKTEAHNLTVLNGLSLFHGLGCAMLVGASRKGFIGRITGVKTAAERVHGSVAVALAAVAQGAQILRVHDVAETAQALKLWQAIVEGQGNGT